MVLERSRREELKKYFGGMKEPVAIVDKNLKCVYSNRPKLLPVDSSIKGVFSGNTDGLLSVPGAKMAMINGCFYSVRVTPIEEELYVCDFFDLSAIISLAGNTDIYNRIFPIVDAVEYNTSALWRGISTLKSKLENDERGGLECVADMEKRLVSLSSCSKNISEYMNMLNYTPRGDTAINLVSIAADIVKRCNTELSDMGRFVDYVCEEQELYINAKARHVLSALVNAIQNALIYSTRDCVPSLTITKHNQTEEAIIKLVNNSSLYVERDSGEEPSINFSGQRLGYGIPIIKRFAELAGGTFSLTEANGQFSAVIELPLVDEETLKSKTPTLSSGGYVYYQTDIPDIIGLKMREVIDLFGA